MAWVRLCLDAVHEARDRFAISRVMDDHRKLLTATGTAIGALGTLTRTGHISKEQATKLLIDAKDALGLTELNGVKLTKTKE